MNANALRINCKCSLMLDRVEDRDRIELSGGSGMGSQGAREMRGGHQTAGQDGEDSALG